MRILKKILFILLFVSLSANSFADQLTSVLIKPNNTVNLYFDNYISKFDTKLSDNKKEISISIPDCNIDENAKRVVGTATIEAVYSDLTNEQLNINIYLDKEFGYTAVFLPFSRNLKVEVFNWSELTKSEDNYRTALLALEDNIYQTALDELNNAAKQKQPQAVSLLGLLQYESGNYNTAKKFLELAIELDSNTPDIFAGLALINLDYGDSVNYSKYFNLFKEKSGRDILNTFSVDSVLQNEFLSLNINYIDSLLNHVRAEKERSIKTDSAITEKFPGLFEKSKDSLETSKNNSSIFPWWTEYLLMVIAIVVLLIILRYLKWRNKKLLSMQKDQTKTKKKFDDILNKQNKNLKVNSNLAAKTYTQAQQNDTREKIYKKAEEEQLNKQKLNDVIKEQLDTKKENALKEIKTSKKKVPPKIELAMHLAKEQQNIKNKNLQYLKYKELPADAEKLNEVAQKLGIEKGSLEVKNAIDRISKDPDQVAKLAEKFSQFGKR